eukprot:g29462.t1
MSHTHTWTAPTSGAPAAFAAVCGDSTEMNVAAHVSNIRMATGSTNVGGATRSAGALLSLTFAAALYLLKF